MHLELGIEARSLGSRVGSPFHTHRGWGALPLGAVWMMVELEKLRTQGRGATEGILWDLQKLFKWLQDNV